MVVVSLPAEVAAALSRGDDETRRALVAVQELKQLPGLIVESVDEMLGDLANFIAAAKRLLGCDAVYVASALTLNATLITLDRQQRERSPKVVVVLTPGEVLAQL